MDNDEFSKFISSVRAMAETVSIFYKSLIENGIKEDAAIQLTSSLISAIFLIGGNKND